MRKSKGTLVPIKVDGLPVEIDMYNEGRKAGIKEVAEWLKTKHRDEGGIG